MIRGNPEHTVDPTPLQYLDRLSGNGHAIEMVSPVGIRSGQPPTIRTYVALLRDREQFSQFGKVNEVCTVAIWIQIVTTETDSNYPGSG